ncbi:Na+/phosphate symporter [Caldicoprobacter guelmensis]|uniref:Na/Pi symporter n=1 Tax=Caldicoprobacter guelmensis TaxID=1170224 RepID=UPI003742164C|nr:Na+/phosphate symporter [Caldicoprobacter guelmensis]
MTGTLVTVIIQSSSATTVMIVGLVNAGLLNLMQATGVIMGANIGTTITAQLIALKLTKIALPAIGLGTTIYMFSKK